MLLAVETLKPSVAVGFSMTEQGECFRIKTLFSPHNFFFYFYFFCVEAQVCAVHEEKFLLKASQFLQPADIPPRALDSFICPRDPPAEMKSGWSSGSPGLQLHFDDCKKRRITIKMESDAKPGNKDAMTKPLY